MKCAFIEWVDSMHQSDWVKVGDIKETKPEYSCGILLNDGTDCVTIALSYAQETDEYGHVISIPRVAIKSIAVFERRSGQKPRAKKSAAPQERNVEG